MSRAGIEPVTRCLKGADEGNESPRGTRLSHRHVRYLACGAVSMAFDRLRRLPLRLQLQGNGLCWEAVYSTPKQNSDTLFKAVAD